MIGSLRGRLLDRGTADGVAGEVLVEVAGVGYRVVVAPTTAVALGDVGDEVFVREDADTLYGFGGRDERITFGALLGAHGVGPSLALAILSVHDPVALARILAEDDVGALCLVPGVGKKTAARLLVELKSRLHIPEIDPRIGAGSRHASNANGGGATYQPSARSDVREALAGLGYSADEILGATAQLPDDVDTPQLLRQALRHLATARQGLVP